MDLRGAVWKQILNNYIFLSEMGLEFKVPPPKYPPSRETSVHYRHVPLVICSLQDFLAFRLIAK